MVKEKNPGAALTEVAKKCGEEWRALGEGAKKKYEKKQEEAKKCGEEWRALGEGAKKKYEKKQEEAKKKFDMEYKEWLENGGEEALTQAKKETQEEVRHGVQRMAGKRRRGSSEGSKEG